MANDKDEADMDDLDELPPERPIRQSGAYKTKRNGSKKSKKSILIVIVVLVVIAVIAAVGYELINHKKAKKSPQTATTNTIQPAISSNASSSSSDLNYVSNGTDLNLSFSYPSDWSVTPASNTNTSDQTITITSPLVSMDSSNGSSVTGKIVATIRPGNSTIAELNANSPTEAIASAQFSYTKPTASQLDYPYLSYIHFGGGSTVAGSFSEVIVTGQLQFSAGQALTAADLSGIDPIVSASFTQCLTQTCTGSDAASLDINSTTWQNTLPFTQLQDIFSSMAFN